MPRPSAATLPPADVRRVAVLAEVDPRTVATYLSGRRATVPQVAAAIAKALRRIKRGDLVRLPSSATV